MPQNTHREMMEQGIWEILSKDLSQKLTEFGWKLGLGFSVQFWQFLLLWGFFFLLFSFVALHKLFCSKLTWVVLLHEYSYGIILLWTVVITLDSSCLNTIWILWRNSMSFVYLPHHCRILRSVLPIQSTHEVTLVVSLFSLEQLYLSYEGVKLIFT